MCDKIVDKKVDNKMIKELVERLRDEIYKMMIDVPLNATNHLDDLAKVMCGLEVILHLLKKR